MIHISTINIAEAWFDLLGVLQQIRINASPRGIASRELCGVTVRVGDMLQNVLAHPGRDLNYRFMVAEWLWILFGRNDAATIGKHCQAITRFANEKGRFDGAYGPRLKSQWDYLLDRLRYDPDTRQAVATIWTPNPTASKDVSCTVALQLLHRDGRLHGIVTMRSSDVWLGLPYDFFSFSMLINVVAAQLGIPTGSLTFQLGSSHLYETDAANAEAVLKNRVNLRVVASPAFKELPPQTLDRQLSDPVESISMPEPWFTYALALFHPKERALKLLERLTSDAIAIV